ncbi:MAG: hypothetical protein ACMUIP_09465 [bacterium]
MLVTNFLYASENAVSGYAHFDGIFSFLLIVITFGLWMGFPLWFSARRAQGIINIEKTGPDGERRQAGMLLELGIFFFLIPSMFFAIFVFFNFLLSFFFKETVYCFNLSLQITAIIIDCALLLYIYMVEKKKREKCRSGFD